MIKNPGTSKDSADMDLSRFSAARSARLSHLLCKSCSDLVELPCSRAIS